MLYNSIIDTIGKTPLVKLNKLTQDLDATIYVKMESKNPGASVKDRLALAMITQAEKDGVLDADTRIIEPTSGNTGVGLAMLSAVKGYDLTIVMPESASIERRQIMKAYGKRWCYLLQTKVWLEQSKLQINWLLLLKIAIFLCNLKIKQMHQCIV